MELYILDSLLRRIEVVDSFESLIWTERFASTGDFQLLIKSTRGSRMMFTEGTRLALNLSYRVMTVETVTNATNADGKAVLKVAGRSLESLLDDRIAKDTLANLTTEPTWNLTGKPGDIARQIFNDICVRGDLHIGDKIPFIQPGTIFPADTIPEPQTTITRRIEPKTVYEAIKEICDSYDLGFRLVRNFDTSQLYFNIYAGNDRTTRQTLKAPVIFALDYDNLQNTTEFTSIEKAKNVALVVSEHGTEVVYGDNVPSDVDGFDRRVMLVKASNIEATTPDIPGALQQQGKEALAQARSFTAFDGEINQRTEFVYGVDYGLGDVVEIRSSDGVITYKRVSEQIFVSDAEGEKSYPTFSMNAFVAANTWLSQLESTVWKDFDYEAYAFLAWNDTSDLLSFPPGINFSGTNFSRFRWAANTTDERALLGPDGITRNAACWFSGSKFSAKIAFTSAWAGYVRLYAVDWDGNNSRKETINVTDSVRTTSQSIVNFSPGRWLSFPVQAAAGSTVTIEVVNDNTATNAVLSGIFLDSAESTWIDQ